MKFSISTQTKLSMALLVLIGTQFTLAEMTSKAETNHQNCQAVLSAKFTESAPRDRFHFSNVSSDGWQVQSVMLQLAGSDGNLIFDTEEGGTGVEVFQKFREESQSATTAVVNEPADGDQSLTIEFSDFPAGANYTFSIDLDDQLKQSELGNIRVSGSEINGAVISVSFVSPDGKVESADGTFDSKSHSHVAADCG